MVRAASATPRRFAVQHDMPNTSASSRGHHLFDADPREGRQVQDLDLVARAEGLGAEREQPVRRLKEVGVEIAGVKVGGRPLGREVRRLPCGRIFQGGG